MRDYLRFIEARLKAEEAKRRDDAAFLLWLIFECRAALSSEQGSDPR